MSEKKETKPLTVAQALEHMQKNIKAPRSQYNKFGGYYYRSCEDVLEGAKKVMPEGVTLIVLDEVVYIEGRFYVKASATLSCNGESITAFGWAREADSKKGMDESQVTGATSSYARKYALNGLFCIDDAKDADSDEHKKQQDGGAPKQQPKPEKSYAEKFRAAEQWVNEHIAGLESIEDVYALDEMREDDAAMKFRKRIEAAYPDLYQRICDAYAATAERLGI